MYTRINVGCGDTPTAGWRNFDNSISLRLSSIPLLPSLLFRLKVIKPEQMNSIRGYARLNQIEYADVTKGLPVKTGSIDTLYSSHMIEHLDLDEVKAFLREAKRVLQSKGIIRLAVPDLRLQVDNYIARGDADEFMDISYLCEPRPKTLAARLSLLATGPRKHQWMYDGPSLCKLLTSHGFADPTIQKAGKTRIPNPGALNLREREEESVYVEAVKP